MAGLAELGLRADAPHLIPPLAALAVRVRRWSGRINLTGHQSPEAVARRLLLDAIALGCVLPEAPTIADLGSGAGFPGLPLALLRPAARVTLVEARQRRHHFQRAVVRELGLANAFPVWGRAEQLEAVPQSMVVAQAMARPSQALAWMVRWAEPGGFLVIPGGAQPARIEPPAGVKPLEMRRYRVPLGGPERTVWLGVLLAGESPGRRTEECVT